MKLILVRCGICDMFFGAWRNHCQHCGATRAMKIGKKVYHFDVVNRLQMVKGFYTYRMEGKTFESIKERS